MSTFEQKYPILAATPGTKLIVGSFETDGAGDPVNVRGTGFTVAAPSSGTYTVTLDQRYVEVHGHIAGIEDATANSTAGARAAGSTNGTNAAKATATIITSSSAGVDANLDGPRVNFLIAARYSDITA